MISKSSKKGVLTEADIKALQKYFATKDDLNRFATKDDLDKYATKNYLDTKLDQQKDGIVDEFKKFRSNFYDKIDPILKEVLASREERTIRAEQHRRSQDRIEKLERIHPQGRHLATV